MRTPRFTWALLHPKYFLTWLAIGIIAVIAQLPFTWQMAMGRMLGWMAFYCFARRKHIARCNIALCFPEKSPQARERLLRDHFITNGITFFEIGMAWFKPQSFLLSRCVVKGQEHWQALQQQGRGALIIGLHFNTLEIAAPLVSHWFDVHLSYRPHNNPVFDFVQYHRRQRNNAHVAIDRRDMRGMLRALKQGGWLWYAPDQDYGRKVSEFVDWFGGSIRH